MKRKIVALLAALTCATAAQAADPTWTFSYSGFYNEEQGFFDPNFVIGGSFSGVDQNRDGVIERGELSSFQVDGVDYAHCANPGIPNFSCGLSAFAFSNKVLNFTTTMYSSDPEGWVSRGTDIVSGVKHAYYYISPVGSTDSTMTWTADTRFDLQSPVPEANTYAMLLAGLGCLGVMARVRARNGS